MTKKVSKIIRIILLLVGYGIILLCYNLFPMEKVLPSVKLFFWINIALMYSFIFIPFFLSNINSKNVDRKTPSLVIVWTNVFIFNIVALVLTILVYFSIFSLSVGITIEVVLLFFIAIMIFLGYVGNSHVSHVQQSEAVLLSLITTIRNSFDLLVVKSGILPDSCADEKKKIEALSEDVKYMAPVNDAAAYSIEQQILEKINSASAACEAAVATGDFSNLKVNISNLEVLIQQRKLLRTR